MFFCRPTGWDNDKKISILHENLQNIKPQEAYEDVITKPITRKVGLYICSFVCYCHVQLFTKRKNFGLDQIEGICRQHY